MNIAARLPRQAFGSPPIELPSPYSREPSPEAVGMVEHMISVKRMRQGRSEFRFHGRLSLVVGLRELALNFEADLRYSDRSQLSKLLKSSHNWSAAVALAGEIAV